MIVAGREGAKVVKTVDGDSVFGCIVTNSGSVTRNVTLGNIICGLCTKEEPITTNNSVGSERRTL